MATAAVLSWLRGHEERHHANGTMTGRLPSETLNSRRHPHSSMPNIGYFEIPADDTGRAKRFYGSLLGWKFSPAANLDPAGAAPLQYHSISTGPEAPGTMNAGGLYKRQGNEPIKNFVLIEDFDAVYGKVGKLGGSVIIPKTEIAGVGTIAIIRDSEGNGIGLFRPVNDR